MVDACRRYLLWTTTQEQKALKVVAPKTKRFVKRSFCFFAGNVHFGYNHNIHCGNCDVLRRFAALRLMMAMRPQSARRILPHFLRWCIMLQCFKFAVL